jgi:hypothetical protein
MEPEFAGVWIRELTKTEWQTIALSTKLTEPTWYLQERNG